MAGLFSTIKLNDGMSAPLKNIAKTMGSLISTMERASGVDIAPKKLNGLPGMILNAKKQLSDLKNIVAQINPGLYNNAQKQREWNKEITNANLGMNGLMNKIKGIAATLGAGLAVKNLVNLSDEAISIDARLNLITDTAEQKGNLKNYIYQMAQESKAPLNAFTSDVAKLGLLASNVFSNNGEIVQFIFTIHNALLKPNLKTFTHGRIVDSQYIMLY